MGEGPFSPRKFARKLCAGMSNSQYKTLKRKLIMYIFAVVIFGSFSWYMYRVFIKDFLFRLTWNDYYYWYKAEAWSLSLTLIFVGFSAAQILTVIPILLMPLLMLLSKACGNIFCNTILPLRRRIVFFGISTSLGNSMENIMRKIPSEEQISEWKGNSSMYIVPVQAELQRRFKSQLDIISSGSSVERFGISQDSKKQESYGALLCNWIKRVYCFCYPWGLSYSSLMTDHDIMFVPCDMTVSFTPGRARFCAITATYDNPDLSIPLGFAHVVSYHSVDPFQEFCVSYADAIYLSNKLVKNVMFSVVDNIPEEVFPSECASSFIDCHHPPAVEVSVKGPSVGCKIYPAYQVCVMSENQEIVRFEGDFVFSLRCLEWPPCAESWVSRPRFWPDDFVIDSVVSEGCLLVPRPSDKHPNSDLEWRISFSKAEVSLSKHIPDSARKFFLALKIVYKDHLKFVCPHLKTYHLKTLFYWAMESHSLVYWDNEHCEEIFVSLLRELQRCVHEKHLSHYWIEGVNLLAEFENTACKDLNALLSKIMEKPEPYVFDVASLWC